MTTEMKTVARCAIYDQRPPECQSYPLIDSYLPEQCTYYFVGNERRGECACDEGACCAIPRDGGEPTASHLPDIAGGLPCKHLVLDEVPVEKVAVVCAPSVPADFINLNLLVDGPDDS